MYFIHPLSLYSLYGVKSNLNNYFFFNSENNHTGRIVTHNLLLNCRFMTIVGIVTFNNIW
jgi:hypothetical protein